jgi:hypothetical protein
MHCGDIQNGVKLVVENPSQSEKFKQAARDLECDPDEALWDDRLKKVAKAKPSPNTKAK